MANERHSYPDDYRGTRTKGRRSGSLWYSERDGEGDITFFEYYDNLYSTQRVEVLTDWIGMLQRELRVQQAMMEKEASELFKLPFANQ
jgi:hypothetical protein